MLVLLARMSLSQSPRTTSQEAGPRRQRVPDDRPVRVLDREDEGRAFAYLAGFCDSVVPPGSGLTHFLPRSQENVMGSVEAGCEGGWLPHPEEQLFLDQLYAFMDRQGSPIHKVPHLGFKKSRFRLGGRRQRGSCGLIVPSGLQPRSCFRLLSVCSRPLPHVFCGEATGRLQKGKAVTSHPGLFIRFGLR